MSRDEDELRTLFGRLADRQPARGTDGVWLTDRLRRRRSRQQLAAGALAVLAVAGGVSLVSVRGERSATVASDVTPSPTTPAPTRVTPSPVRISAGRAPVPPPLTATTGGQLVVVQGTHIELLDVDSGARTPLPTDPRLVEHDRLDVLDIEGELVMVGNDNTGAGSGPYDVFATTSGPGSAVRRIGSASYLIRSEDPGRVWLVSENDSNDADVGTTLEEVDLQGVVHQHRLFRHDFRVEPFAGGFLRATVNDDGSSGDETELVDGQGRRLRLLQGSQLVVSGSTAVLSIGDLPCAERCRLRVLTWDTELHERVVDFAALPYLFEPVLSPDQRSLYVTEPVDEVSPRGSRLHQLDLDGGESSEVSGAWAATYYGPSTCFSPDGRWAFFTDATGRHIDAYDLTARRAYRVRGSFDYVTQLLTAP